MTVSKQEHCESKLLGLIFLEEQRLKRLKGNNVWNPERPFDWFDDHLRLRDFESGFIRVRHEWLSRVQRHRALGRLERCGLILRLASGSRHSHCCLTASGRKLARQVLKESPAM